MFCKFNTTTHGKWILAGEHAVLRGHPALVFPIKERQLSISYIPTTTNLSAEFQGNHGNDAHLLFWSVIEHGLHLIDLSINSVTGHFVVHSNIPIGAGMGASAALCAAISRWFFAQNLLLNQSYSIDQFATSLEDLFHGRSSGLDIVGSSVTGGHFFQNGLSTPILQYWYPHLFLSSSSQIGITSHCINQVTQLWQDHPAQAEIIDLTMRDAVLLAKQALEQSDQSAGLAWLSQSINNAAQCFQQWGLVSENLLNHMNTLKEKGAIAVKPTGSGGGGHILSLWKNPPSLLLQNELELIPL